MAEIVTFPSVKVIDDAEAIISVQHIGKMYKLYSKITDRLKQTLFWRFGKQYGRDFWALHDVSLTVHKGETVGILGRNGSGKSTLLQIVAGVIQPTEGTIQVKGKISALLDLGSGFNPEYSGSENVIMSGAILGYSRAEVERRYDEIVTFADIGQYIDQPVKIYSSGMLMRLAFAVASCVEPAILIVDEALAVGDIMFQARCFEKIKNLRENGTTTLFVTHDTGAFQNLCDYGYILEKGRVFTHGKPSQVALQYYELLRETEHARQRLEVSAPEQKIKIIEEVKAKEEEIKEKQPLGEYRFGNGAARIVSYKLLNEDNEEVSTILAGSIFKIIVQVEFFSEVKNLSLGIMFRNPQGQNLMGMHSYHENRINFGPHQESEQLEIIVEQEMLLNPGEYLLHLSLADCRSDYDFTSCDSRNNIAKVSVFGPASAYGMIQTAPKFFFNRKIEYQPAELQEIIQNELENPIIKPIIEKILSFEQDIDNSDFEHEERSWPGESRFINSGYYKKMLGRYLFAGNQFCKNMDVLDACCGVGWGTYIASAFSKSVTAFDNDSAAVKFAESTWRARNVRWCVGDAVEMSFLAGTTFDTALCMEAIEHLSRSDGELFIQQIANHIRSGGIIIGTSAFPDTPWEAEEIKKKNPFHLHIYTQGEMLQLMKSYFKTAVIIDHWMFIGIKE